MTKIKARTVLAFVAIVGYILITLGFFVVLFFGQNVSLPEGELGKQIIGMFGLVVGNWGGLIMLVFMYNYGTTQGSSEKNEAINQALRTVPPSRNLQLGENE